MTITEARDALNAQYIAAGLEGGPGPGHPILGASVSTYDGGPVLKVDLDKRWGIGFTPEESKPGVGYQGFRVVCFRGGATFVSDSGIIA